MKYLPAFIWTRHTLALKWRWIFALGCAFSFFCARPGLHLCKFSRLDQAVHDGLPMTKYGLSSLMGFVASLRQQGRLKSQCWPLALGEVEGFVGMVRCAGSPFRNLLAWL